MPKLTKLVSESHWQIFLSFDSRSYFETVSPNCFNVLFKILLTSKFIAKSILNDRKKQSKQRTKFVSRWLYCGLTRHIFVVVQQFIPWFNFRFLFLGSMVMYGNEFELKKIKSKPRVKLNNKIYMHGPIWVCWLLYDPLSTTLWPRGSCFLLSLVYSFHDVLNQNKDNKTSPVE